MFGGRLEALEIVVPDSAKIIGLSLAEVKIPKGLIIGAIVRGGQVLIPNGQTVVEAGSGNSLLSAKRGSLTEQAVLSRQRGSLHELWHGGKGDRKSPTS